MLSVRILPKYCSCMNLLGRDQGELEATNNRQVRAKELGYRRTCCFLNVADPPLYFVKITDSSIFVDNTGSFAKRSPPVIVPKRIVPSFPSSFPPGIGMEDEDEGVVEASIPEL